MKNAWRVALTAILITGSVVPGVASAQLRPSASAMEVAEAIVANPSASLVDARFWSVPPEGQPNGISDAHVSSFPAQGTTYGILTTGNVESLDDPNDSTSTGTDLDGGSLRGDTDRDVSVLGIELSLPETARCLSLDFQFLSEEYPEFVGSEFNDAFIAELDTSTWTTSGSEIVAPDNFAFGPSGEVISINGTGHSAVSPTHALGTTYDSATTRLRASTPVQPGLHTVFLSIFDQGDNWYDSAVIVDRLTWGRAAHECEEGTEPVQPVVFVHGIDYKGRSGGTSNWCTMIDALRRWGWAGELETVAYYEDDVLGRCRAGDDDGYDQSIDGYGLADLPPDANSEHDVHHGRAEEHTGELELDHDNDTDIRHLAYHFAWYVNERFSQRGVSIKVVAHSMGGLIVRYAIAQVQRGHEDFPDSMLVDEVITLGTPHGGALHHEKVCPGSDQCKQMDRDGDDVSPFLDDLRATANNPQATGGTTWTIMGSYGDFAVNPKESSVDNDMDAKHRVMYLREMRIGHSDYHRETSDTMDADVRYVTDADSWRRLLGTTKCNDSPWPVRWVYLTLGQSQSVDPCG